ncbi:uncharacterized protein LOC133902286 [Phragmites australis]|uniref:uncharacterized protein LOC133902286 n=1 Tax=Phragmites australis TaxID=29695 RepID=UPI002D76E599|nr:uncharacterized protein LOC133902286 [Phragmites australis]
MRCAVVLLALLLSLSALSAATAEAHKEQLGDNAVSLTGRKWLRGRKIMAAPRNGDGKSTGANEEADASAEAVHDSGKRSKGSATHSMFQEARHGDTAAVASEMLGMDYNYQVAARRHQPVNNDAPLGELAKKP